ncbi:tRNA (adenine(37)-N6)-methyltransferase [Takifugu flavidus]|uniref:tRNA (Adenine(37)-N6)-methyltransferase n=1 Tax=Takifugu flavidus TaxID=433684 RepID=A0A5C6MVE4_9TELE|nr:tRNA (adenine(37)-N6)-methyltransferase [Takifugu flavidus]
MGPAGDCCRENIDKVNQQVSVMRKEIKNLRAELRIQQSVFNNPEHSLFGLEHYSHIWIVFVFHKNGHLSYKAKVKPPRLDGKKVGVYSTRSPHRPNALGLTLAKLDKVVGDTLYLSDIDMIDGTPVLDVKPYIPEYDSPHTRKDLDPQLHDLPSCSAKSLTNVLEDVKIYLNQSDCCQVGHASEDKAPVPPKTERLESTAGDLTFGEEAYSTIAGWIRAPPVGSLEVRFTPNAERELAEFLPSDFAGSGETNKPKFKFLHSTEEAAAAISGVLSADPRSVYRRNRCRDRLFFFTLDTAHVTCWFGDGFAEVLQVRPLPQHDVSGASLQMGLDLSES